MYTKKIKLQRAVSYIEMIEDAESKIKKHKKDLHKWEFNSFGNLHEHYVKRIEINKKIINRLKKRIDVLINESLKF